MIERKSFLFKNGVAALAPNTNEQPLVELSDHSKETASSSFSHGSDHSRSQKGPSLGGSENLLTLFISKN